MSEMIYNCNGMSGDTLKNYIKETLDFARPDDEVSFYVDSEEAVKELENYAIEHGHSTRIREDDKGTKITIRLGKEKADEPIEEAVIQEGTIVVLNSSRFGQGNPRLGEKLMQHFLVSFEDAKKIPEAILLYNSAAALVCEDSPCCRQLKRLEKSGSLILVDKESVDFYNLGEQMKTGKTIRMEEMTDMLLGAAKVLKP